MNLVYKITNKTNGKVYIGITTRNLCQRIYEHNYRFKSGERDHKLYLAFRKHGWESFKFEHICSAITKEDLVFLEQMFIKEYNSYNKGYNMTVGGDVVSEETREKLRDIMKRRKVTWGQKTKQTRLLNGGYVPVNKKGYKIQLPNGTIVFGRNIAKFCKEHKINQSNLNKTLSGRNCCKGYILLETFNDYPEREYIQVNGNGRHLESHQGEDIVSSE